jgi:hypothetical protein
VDNESDDPRETLNEVLRNLHGSLKWYWQVVMGLAMVKAVDTLYSILFDEIGTEKMVATLIFSCAFLPTFIRFFFGDSRYLDEHYIELRKWRPIDEYLAETPKKISKGRIVLDIGSLLIIGLLFVFMARSLSHPAIFFASYWALLLFNIVWLTITLRLAVDQVQTKSVLQERYRAPRLWIKNNLWHMILMGPCLFVMLRTPDSLSWKTLSMEFLLIALCVSNSTFDFGRTGYYYFPSLDKEHDQKLRCRTTP